MFQFSHANGLSQPSNLVRGRESGRHPGMEGLLVPWNLGSSAAKAGLEGFDLGLAGSLRGSQLQELVS